MTILRQPTKAGVRDAAEKIARILPPSPIFPLQINGKTVALKAESLQPIGAFKLRGAWHRLTALDEVSRSRGVVAFSSGNHAQGIAWAARRLGIAATIVMPADAPPSKREGTLALGAEIVDYDRATESRELIARRLADIEVLRADPEISGFLAWVRTKPDDFHAATRMTRARKLSRRKVS